MQKELNFSRMPVETWNKLGVNKKLVAAALPEGVRAFAEPEIYASGRIELSKNQANFPVPDPFGNPDAEAVYGALPAIGLRIPEGHAETEPIRLSFRADSAHPAIGDDVRITAGKNSSATIIITYDADEPGTVHWGRTRIWAEPGADITVVKAQTLPDDAVHVDAVSGVAEEGARIATMIAELGASSAVSSQNISLKGEKSRSDMDYLYLGADSDDIDLTVRAEHLGRETVSDIRAKGILTGESRKVFRDTLDFVSGASGSKGREEESVLMLSDRVKNVSIPLLLCGEDDVEGEHAASSGRPDERVLFYLMSRGVDENEARLLLAEAAVASVVEKIPDAGLRSKLLAKLRAAIGKGEKPQ